MSRYSYLPNSHKELSPEVKKRKELIARAESKRQNLEEKFSQLVHELSDGVRQYDIARDLNISKTTIQRALRDGGVNLHTMILLGEYLGIEIHITKKEMKRFELQLCDFTEVSVDDTDALSPKYYSLHLGNGKKVCIEPLIPSPMCYVAIYDKNSFLLENKVKCRDLHEALRAAQRIFTQERTRIIYPN